MWKIFVSLFHENKGGHVCSTCGINYAIKSQFERHVKFDKTFFKHYLVETLI